MPLQPRRRDDVLRVPRVDGEGGLGGVLVDDRWVAPARPAILRSARRESACLSSDNKKSTQPESEKGQEREGRRRSSTVLATAGHRIIENIKPVRDRTVDRMSTSRMPGRL